MSGVQQCGWVCAPGAVVGRAGAAGRDSRWLRQHHQQRLQASSAPGGRPQRGSACASAASTATAAHSRTPSTDSRRARARSRTAPQVGSAFRRQSAVSQNVQNRRCSGCTQSPVGGKLGGARGEGTATRTRHRGAPYMAAASAAARGKRWREGWEGWRARLLHARHVWRRRPRVRRRQAQLSLRLQSRHEQARQEQGVACTPPAGRAHITTSVPAHSHLHLHLRRRCAQLIGAISPAPGSQQCRAGRAGGAQGKLQCRCSFPQSLRLVLMGCSARRRACGECHAPPMRPAAMAMSV